MKLAVSNIGWRAENDAHIYARMRALGYTALEIAPTRFFPEKPYDRLEEAAALAARLRETEKFSVCSMQSLWYGRSERIADAPKELLRYTERAAAFAEAMGCKNLVFGNPRSRALASESEREGVERFIYDAASAAGAHGAVLALEPNPTIYNTNFINTTAEAAALLRRLAHPSARLNLDCGTLLANGEDIAALEDCAEFICHVHISEPRLVPVERRALHREVRAVLESNGYTGYISIEMGARDDTAALEHAMEYTAEVFG